MMAAFVVSALDDAAIAEVLVDDRRAHVRHLRALGELIDDECVERVVVRHRDVQQEILLAGRHGRAERLRQGRRPVRNCSMTGRAGGRRRTAITACTPDPPR